MTAQALVWVTPSALDGPQRSYDRTAAALGKRAEVELKELEVWRLPASARYEMQVEVAAVARAAVARGFERYHLLGFSAGASVALAAALELGDAIRSVTVIEPATIGDDVWGPAEAAWRAEFSAVCAMHDPDARIAALRRMMLAEGEPVPPARGRWDARGDRLERMLANVGFVSGDLESLTQPCLVVTGGRSNPRFARLAERLLAVLPDARSVTFPDRSHLSPPMREETERFSELLLELWSHC